MKKKNIFKIIITFIITFIIAVVLFVGNYLVEYALGRSGDGGNRDVSLEVEEKLEGSELIIQTNKELEKNKVDEFVSNHVALYASINHDNLKLEGEYYLQENSHRWALLIHGYRSSRNESRKLVPYYYEQGFNTLTPDLRACGESEGNYIGMGITDRDDILEWIDWIVEKDPECEIVIHGISMGAATCMNVAGYEDNDHIKVYIEDCGYTSAFDVFKTELKLRFNLPAFPVLYSANLVSTVKAGYDFKKVNPLDSIQKCEKPMLLIHGTNDDFIPFKMLDTLYNAKPGIKQKLVAKEAGHAEARYILGNEYYKTVFDFINANI